MATNLDAIKGTLVGITKGENVLDMLIEFERTLDNLEIFAYKNWLMGELVSGPDIERYWFVTTWMFLYKMMPDPDAGLRLTKIGAKVFFEKSTFSHPAKVRGPEDWADPISKKAKTVTSDVWLVTIKLPMKYITRGLEQMDSIILSDLEKANSDLAQAMEESQPLPEPEMDAMAAEPMDQEEMQ